MSSHISNRLQPYYGKSMITVTNSDGSTESIQRRVISKKTALGRHVPIGNGFTRHVTKGRVRPI